MVRDGTSRNKCMFSLCVFCAVQRWTIKKGNNNRPDLPLDTSDWKQRWEIHLHVYANTQSVVYSMYVMEWNSWKSFNLKTFAGFLNYACGTRRSWALETDIGVLSADRHNQPSTAIEVLRSFMWLRLKIDFINRSFKSLNKRFGICRVFGRQSSQQKFRNGIVCRFGRAFNACSANNLTMWSA